MKKIFVLSACLVAATGFLTSCSKAYPPDTITNPPSGHPQATSSSYLADKWDRDVNGLFTSRIRNNNANSSRGNEKVYLVTANGEIQINQFTFFMGGELWAEITSSELIIYFRYSGNDLPFSYLVIKVVTG